MKNLVIAALVFGTAASALQAVETGLESYTFDEFAKAFGKTYATAEERAEREAIFNQNVEMIRTHNANPAKTFTMAVNHMADYTQKEFKSVIGHIPAGRRGLTPFLQKLQTTSETEKVAIPDAVDWRNRSAVTAVKDQGNCGSCWAFASTENMESHWAIATGQLLDLSTQQVTSCTPNPRQCGGTGGCQGATSELGYEYAINAGGLVLAKDWPYNGRDGNCKPPNVPVAAKFSSYVPVPSNDQDAVLQALATKGPLTIGVWADPMMFYSRGVFSGCDYNKNMAINHAVQLVGYGSEAGKDYWIVRNSWGASWGEKGYIRLQRDAVAQCGMDKSPKDGSACKDDPDTPIKVCGQCGILYETSYPIARTQ